MQVYISGLGAYIPPNIYTNADICEAIGLPVAKGKRYEALLGVRERPICVDYRDGGRQIVSGEDLAYSASLAALEDAGLAASDLDAVIACSAFFDYIAPPISSRLLKRLGIEQAYTLDLIGGCAEFLHGVHVASNMIRLGQARTVLVTSSETINAWWAQTRFPIEHFIFGDTGGAMIVTDKPSAYRIADCHLSTKSKIANEPAELICMPIIGGKAPPKPFYEAKPASPDIRHLSSIDDEYRLVHSVHQVALAAPTAMCEATRLMIKRNDLDCNAVYLVPHQASINVLNALGDTGIPAGQIGISLPTRGNMSTSSVPVTWAEHREEASRHKHLVMTSVSVGMSYGAMLLEQH